VGTDRPSKVRGREKQPDGSRPRPQQEGRNEPLQYSNEHQLAAGKTYSSHLFANRQWPKQLDSVTTKCVWWEVKSDGRVATLALHEIPQANECNDSHGLHWE
jgi:hypothetical protein